MSLGLVGRKVGMTRIFSDDERERALRHALGHSVDRHINPLIDEAHGLIERHRPREAMVSARSALALAEQHQVIMPPGAMLHLGYALSDVYDNDGALDFVVVRLDQPPLLAWNASPARGHWLQLTLVTERGLDVEVLPPELTDRRWKTLLSTNGRNSIGSMTNCGKNVIDP